LFALWLPPYAASLAYAVANVLFWYAVLRELDRRGVYLKV
jgi:predicted acyltransferase